MIKRLCFLLFVLPFASQASGIQAFLSYATFNSPANGPYVETYISVIGNSLKYVKNENGKYQGTVEIAMLFKREGLILQAKKYNLLSPELTDSSAVKVNFIDQQRLSLLNGNYELEISVSDKNIPEAPFNSTQRINVDFSEKELRLSDIQLIESYTKSSSQNILSKSGYDLVPYVSNFYPENLSKIGFYAELYNAKKSLGENEPFIINYFIRSNETSAIMSNFRSFSKQKAESVNIVLSEFPIEDLPSGNYNLVIEVRDKANKLLSSKQVFFQRKNLKALVNMDDLAAINMAGSFVEPIVNMDTIAEYIRCLRPISTESEKVFSENQLKLADIQLMKQYFLNFWKKRDPVSPEQAWLNYYKDVKLVNQSFTCGKTKGYNTDRGRVYLQYGSPDQRAERPVDVGCFPYEIWQYYKLASKSEGITQANKSLIFYSPHYTGCDFKLLHSNAIGELQERQWREIVCEDHYNQSGRSRVPGADDRDLSDHLNDDFGNHLNELFNNPR